MCILFCHTNENAEEGQYKIILASNRDEFFVRDAKVAARWSTNPTIISGLDMLEGREGGTWLGLGILEDKHKLRIGTLLNVTGEERKTGALGRGFIVTDYLRFNEDNTDEYVKKLKAEPNHNAFSFVGIELMNNTITSHHYSNVSTDAEIKFEGKQTEGFSNSLPDCPLSKVTAGKKRFREIIKKHNNSSQHEDLVNNLINLLKWDERHLPDPELQRRAPDTYKYRTSVYVSIPAAGYGTRTHTVILVDWKNEVHFIEDTMNWPIDPYNVQWRKQVIKARL